MARIVLRNALFFGRARFSELVIPWCTYTDPEVAHVGLTAEEAGRQGLKVRTFRVPLAEVDRAVLDGDTDGFAQAHVGAGGDRIVGATARRTASPRSTSARGATESWGRPSSPPTPAR